MKGTFLSGKVNDETDEYNFISFFIFYPSVIIAHNKRGDVEKGRSAF